MPRATPNTAWLSFASPVIPNGRVLQPGQLQFADIGPGLGRCQKPPVGDILGAAGSGKIGIEGTLQQPFGAAVVRLR